MNSRRTRRFNSVAQAINYFRFNNPARQKFLDLTEPERITTNYIYQDFTGDHPSDIWASVCHAIAETVNNDRDPLAARIFSMKFLGERDQQFSRVQIAEELGLTKKHVSRVVNRLFECLESELIRRELLEPLLEDMN